MMANHAFIDGANLHKGLERLGWKLDYGRFRKWLAEKYDVKIAYIFLGNMPSKKRLYERLSENGFVVVLRDTIVDRNGLIKGNCDAAMVLAAAIGYFKHEYVSAVIISSDGDFAELIGFLWKGNALRIVISPSKNCSYLIRRLNVRLSYLDEQRSVLESLS